MLGQSRRFFLTGLGTLLAAPAIVKAHALMPVKVHKGKLLATSNLTLADGTVLSFNTFDCATSSSGLRIGLHITDNIPSLPFSSIQDIGQAILDDCRDYAQSESWNLIDNKGTKIEFVMTNKMRTPLYPNLGVQSKQVDHEFPESYIKKLTKIGDCEPELYVSSAMPILNKIITNI